MSDVIAVRIPQENVNDEVVTLLEWRVAHGAAVEADQVLAEVEGSKATFEITSPARGVIHIAATNQREIPVGSVLCHVGPSIEAIEAWVARQQPATQPEPAVKAADLPAGQPRAAELGERAGVLLQSSVCPEAKDVPPRLQMPLAERHQASALKPHTTRFSQSALEAMRQQGLQESDFQGRGLVRARDLAARGAPAASGVPANVATHAGSTCATGSSSAPTAATGVPVRTETLPRSKRLEARRLALGAHQALRSAVTVRLATAGAQPLRKTHPDAAELLAAHLIAECGRLLRKFPHLNAYCSGDEVHFYERVNVGYALDAGRGLKVPVFRDADLKEPETILQERREFIEAYLNNRLSPGALAGGTFSITDLSGSGVVQFEPLIVEGQAAILGVGANFLPATRPGVAYNLTLAFDHRLIEGRAAARFLNELKERMLAHEEGPARAAFEPDAPEPKCALCGMDRQQAASHKHFLVSTAGPVPGNTHWICTVCLQGR